MLGTTVLTDTSPCVSPTALKYLTPKPILKSVPGSAESPEPTLRKSVRFIEKVEYKQRTVTWEDNEEPQFAGELVPPEVVKGKSACCELF